MSQISEGVVLEAQPRRPRLVVILLVLWLITAIALVAVAWSAYLGEKDKTLTLAEQIQAACERGDLGEGLDPEDEKVLCDNAKAVIEENDPELQDGEIQEEEVQEPEIQEPEIQGPEFQDREAQEREAQERENQEAEDQESERQEGESQDPEIQDPEEQEPENQDPENQDPEIDDPDPASPYEFSFTFTIPGDNPAEPDRTYTVTCNSGTGNCNVQSS